MERSGFHYGRRSGWFPSVQTGCFSPTSENPGRQQMANLCICNSAFVFAAGLEAPAKFRAETRPHPLLHTGTWLQPLKTRRLVRLWSLA